MGEEEGRLKLLERFESFEGSKRSFQRKGGEGLSEGWKQRRAPTSQDGLLLWLSRFGQGPCCVGHPCVWGLHCPGGLCLLWTCRPQHLAAVHEADQGEAEDEFEKKTITKTSLEDLQSLLEG